jgi:hypothetical protein
MSAKTFKSMAALGSKPRIDPIGPNVRCGSWSCQNAWREAGFGDGAVQVFCRSGYARIAAMSGWIPTMFITRVTL